jgi:hypothetical protein
VMTTGPKEPWGAHQQSRRSAKICSRSPGSSWGVSMCRGCSQCSAASLRLWTVLQLLLQQLGVMVWGLGLHRGVDQGGASAHGACSLPLLAAGAGQLEVAVCRRHPSWQRPGCRGSQQQAPARQAAREHLGAGVGNLRAAHSEAIAGSLQADGRLKRTH